MMDRIGKPIMTTAPLLLAVAIAMLLGSCTIGGSHSADGGFTPTAQGPVLAAENAAQATPGYEDGSIPWEQQDAGVVQVAVQPAAQLQPGDGKMVRSVSSVPFSQPLAGPGHSVGLECDALNNYEVHNAGPSEVQGLTFDPNGGSAWAFFELKRDDSLPTSVALAWHSLPLEFGKYYVGIADRSISSWRWFGGPDDGVLSFDASGMTLGDTALVAIVLEGSQKADLMKLRWGVSEIRGTGLMAEDPRLGSAGEEPQRASSAALPASTDLNHFAPWVHNQGSFGSCTAFACNDTAFGIMLAQTYGAEGWDSTTTANSTSPLWSYVNSGKPPVASQTFNPLCAGSSGRYMSDAFNVLKQLGTSTEQAAPYTTQTDCSQAFSQTAETEAGIVRIDDWHWLNSSGTALVTAIKTQLANDVPVPMAIYGLENSLLYYSGGVYEFGGTAGLNGGHAMCIVGYDDGLQAFDIRNQWGSNWGSGGHVWFSYNSVASMSQLGRFYAYYMDVSYSANLASHFLGGGSPDPVDQGEPNNTRQSASQLAAFPVENAQYTLGYSGDELDWLKFQYTDGMSTTFTATSNPAQLTLTAELYDSGGTLITGSYNSGSTQQISGVWSGSGTAYLLLQLSSGQGAYTIAAVSTSPPAIPTGLSVSANSQVGYGLNLNWQASANADSYIVQRSRSQSGPFAEIGSSYTTTYFDFTARDWGTYYYRLQASGGGGISLPSAIANGTVESLQVSGLLASQGTYSERVSLSWQALSGVTQYQLYRSQAGSSLYMPLARVTGTTYDDSAAQKGVHYMYRAAALLEDQTGQKCSAVEGWRSGSVLVVQDELRPDGGGQTVDTDGNSQADVEVHPVVNDGSKAQINP